MALAAMLALTPSLARAACPGVQLDFRGDRWSEELRLSTAAEVELEGERAGLCEREQPASVLLLWQGTETLGIAVDLTRDDGTELQLRRKVDTAQLPVDGLPLVVSAVVGDLLRESRPPEVAPAPEAAAERRFAVGVRGGGAYGGSSVRGGGELLARVFVGRFAVQLAVGGGAGRAFAGDVGFVDVRLVSLALGGLVRLFGGERWRVSAELGVLGGPWWLSAVAAEGYSASSAMAWVAAGRAGLELAVRPWSRLELLLSAGADLPFRGVAVTDGARRVAQPVGVAGWLMLGAVLTW